MQILGVLNCAIFLPADPSEEEVLQCVAPLATGYVEAFLGTVAVGEIPLPRSEPYGGLTPAQLLVRMNSVGASHNLKATAVLQRAYATRDFILGPAILLFGVAQWSSIQS